MNLNSTDEQLMLSYAAGQPEGFEELFRRHGTKLYNLFLKWENDPEAASDLLQDCFLRVVQARKRYRPETKFSSWIYTIAMNLIRDRQRQRHRRKTQTLSQTDEKNLEILEENNPLNMTVENMLVEAVMTGLNNLPADQKEAIVLSKYQGMSFSEIGEILKISPVAAKQKAYRGLQKLRKQLRHLKEE